MPLKVAVKLLEYISAEHYYEWVQVGMALKASYGEEGFPHWHSWSQKSTKYRGVKELEFKWKTFKREGVSAGTIVYLAKRGGWTESQWQGERGGKWNDDWYPDVTLGFVDSGEVIEPADDTPIWRSVEPRLPDGWPPGLVGDIAMWIGSIALYPCPKQELAASIAAVGALKAHKCRSASDLRTNVYVTSLGLSGSGKEHPRRCIRKLFKAAGCHELLIGEPRSDAGLLSALSNNGGKGLILWDEFHRVLKALGSKYAASYQTEILRMIVMMFTESSNVFLGREYANHDGKMKRVDIDQPCLNIYATCVPEQFREVLTASDSEDGLLARMLVFDADPYVEEPQDLDDVDLTPPDYLVAQVKQWMERPKNATPKDAFDASVNIDPPKYVFDSDAKQRLNSYRLMMRKQTAGAPTMIAPIMARAAEHAEKIAMIAAIDEWHDGELVVDDCVMEWAIKVANYCVISLCQLCDDSISRNDEERAKKKLLSVFAKNRRWLTSSAVVRLTPYLNRRQRNDLLADLCEAGRVEVKQDEGKTKPIISYRFKI